MKCYHHEDYDARGICVACGRALCLDCCLDTLPNRIVCSEACLRAVERDSVVHQAHIENLVAQGRGLRGGRLLLRLLALACALIAFGELAGTFVLVRFIPDLTVMHPISGLGFASAMLLILGICLLGDRLVRRVAGKLVSLVDQLD